VDFAHLESHAEEVLAQRIRPHPVYPILLGTRRYLQSTSVYPNYSLIRKKGRCCRGLAILAPVETLDPIVEQYRSTLRSRGDR